MPFTSTDLSGRSPANGNARRALSHFVAFHRQSPAKVKAPQKCGESGASFGTPSSDACTPRLPPFSIDSCASRSAWAAPTGVFSSHTRR